jgi:hypothetical protein
VRRDAETTIALAVSIAWGIAISVVTYALMRAVQVLVSPDPNPSEVVWSIHAGYVWRIWTVTYAGGLATFVVFLMARRRIKDWASALIPALSVAAALLALQVLFFP